MSKAKQTQQTATHTPGRWNYETAYRITDIFAADPTGENPDRTYIAEIDGQDVGRFATTEQHEANARRICAAVNACQGISIEALERNIIRRLHEVLQTAVVFYERQNAPLADALAWAAKARVILADIADHLPVEPRKPIVIEVHGGVVQDVLNLPPGYQYEIKDYDSLEVDEEAAHQQQPPLDKWLEKWDMPQEASMSEPTNRDRARWARDALAVFTNETFSGDHPDTMHRDDLECAIGDLICDLLHLAHQKGFDQQAILEQGNAHFKAELLLDE